MWGAIIGDIIGSSFEVANHRSKYFEVFRDDAYFTDDTVCTAAIAHIIDELYTPDLERLSLDVISDELRVWACPYLNRNFGSIFFQWIVSGKNKPYDSIGNGSLMRISALPKFCVENNISKNKMFDMAEKITNITHNTAQANNAVKMYVETIYDFLIGSHLTEIEKKSLLIVNLIKYGYGMPEKIEKYRVMVEFDLTAEKSLMVACSGVLEATDFEDVIANVISVGGDSDTYAAIAGALAESIYGIPDYHKEQVKKYFKKYDADLINAINKLYKKEVQILFDFN